MNRLSFESSPYLKNTSHQPIDWWPWCDAAFETATAQNKPILVDVGAEWCHWCHVMDKENYDDEKTAAFINGHFISIKVDRDERPDIDRRLQDSVASLTGQGGWPLTVFLTPDGKPFFGGTYFPPQPRNGMPSFLQVLEHVCEIFKNHEKDIREIGKAVTEQLNKQSKAFHSTDSTSSSPYSTGISRAPFSPESISSYTEAVISGSDTTNGGFGFAPKFPNPETILFLLQYYCRTKQEKTLSCALKALDGMARGGINDHVGGGFHRYSTDPLWRVPHFEKMVAENAMLLRCYLQAFRITKNIEYKEVCLGILGWLLEEMHDPKGGFYASQDADFNGEEGGYFGWTKKELLETLGRENQGIFFEVFSLEPIEGGVHEGGTYVLFRPNTIKKQTNKEQTGTEQSMRISNLLMRLHEHRNKKGKAPTDTTIYTNWSCICAIACLEAGMILGHEEARCAGLKTIERIHTEFLIHGLPFHRKGLYSPLFSEDAVWLCSALLTAYDATLNWNYATKACEIADTILSTFASPSGAGMESGISDTTSETNQELLGIHLAAVWDFEHPGTNPLFGMGLQKLAILFEREDLKAQAESILSLSQDQAGGMVMHASTYFFAQDLMLNGFHTFVVINRIEPDPFISIIHRNYSGNYIILTGKESDHSLIQGKKSVDNTSTVYICNGTACSKPITSPEGLEKELGL